MDDWRGWLEPHDGIELEDALPGHLFDYSLSFSIPPTLRCVIHPGCPQVVEVWCGRLLAGLFMLEKLVGAARLDGEQEQLRLPPLTGPEGEVDDEADEDESLYGEGRCG